MSYWIYPTEPLGRFVGVDLVCTDGTSLRDSGAVDHRVRPMHPAAGHAHYPSGEDAIPLNQWSLIQCEIGRRLGGKPSPGCWSPSTVREYKVASAATSTIYTLA
jgi:hypothetical protein